MGREEKEEQERLINEIFKLILCAVAVSARDPKQIIIIMRLNKSFEGERNKF